MRILRRVFAYPLDLLGVAGAVLYGLPSLWYPFGGDQPIHWYIGVGLLEGQMPYETGISTKPPAAFLVHTFATLLFGEGQRSIRIADMGFVLGCAALIAFMRPRVALQGGAAVSIPPRPDGALGTAALLVSGIYFTFFDWAATAHPELWQAFFMLASIFVIARAPGGRVRAGRAAWAGALATVAVMFKHVAFISGTVAGIAATWLALRHLGWLGALRAASAYTGGVVAVLALTAAPFLFTGTLDAFYEVMVEFILKYAEDAPANTPPVPPFLELDAGGLPFALGLAGLATGAGIALRTRARAEREQAAMIVASTAAAIGTVVAQRRSLVSDVFDYYFIVCVPFLALGIAWGLRQATPRARLGPFLVALALLGIFFLISPAWPAARPEHSFDREWESLLTYLGGGAREDHYRHYGHANRIDRYDTQELVGLEVRRRARPGDTLCVEGFATAIYTVAGLRCPSRHFAEVTAYEGLEGWMEEHRQVLRERPPTFIVTFPDRRERIRELREAGYARHEVPGAALFVIMERRPGEEAPPATPPAAPTVPPAAPSVPPVAPSVPPTAPSVPPTAPPAAPTAPVAP